MKRQIGRAARRSPLLRLPIATQLTLGFLLAALVASLGAGMVGVQRANSLNKQSLFYQKLLQANTSLSNGENLLQLMNTERTQMLTDATVSVETLTRDETSLQNLADRNNTIIFTYVQQELVSEHTDQKALLVEGGHSDQILQQQILALSTLRTWQTYQGIQNQLLTDVKNGDLTKAELLDRVAGEPLNADALSALRTLIQFDARLAKSIQDAAAAEQDWQNLTTIIAVIVVFICIGIIGWFISAGIVRRLQELRFVTQSVENGDIGARARVVGNDELAEVSASVNAMLDTIVRLLEETRRQRDALTHAADRLFTDMRLVGAGDLRAQVTVSNDPIGMLGIAFNLTVGRFRNFLLSSRIFLNQIDNISQHEAKRTQSFSDFLRRPPAASNWSQVQNILGGDSEVKHGGEADLSVQIARVREQVNRVLHQDGLTHIRVILQSAEEAYLASKRLNQLVTALPEVRSNEKVIHLAQLQSQEMAVLNTVLNRIGNEAYAVQRVLPMRLQEINATLAQVSIPQRSSSYPLAGSENNQQPADVINMAGRYAQEIGELSRELHNLINSMHSSIALFQLDANEYENVQSSIENSFR